MIAYLNRGNGRVFVTAVGGGGDQPRAFMSQEIGPGWRFLGRTYEEWVALPDGPHPVPDDYDPDKDYPPPGVGVPVAADAPAADVSEQPEDQPVRALLMKTDGRFRVWAHGSKPGHPLVTLLEDVEPGSRIVGRTYEEWAALPQGWHPVPADWDPHLDHSAPGTSMPE